MEAHEVRLHDPAFSMIDQTHDPMVEHAADESLAHGREILRRHGSLHD
jgi:hypothetical protein